MTEAMVFGIGAGIFFGYFHMSNVTFPKVVNRSRPGSFLMGVPKRLGVKGVGRKYWNRRKAGAELDRLMDEGRPVSLQVDAFSMEYIPNDFRIHINMHFINAIGREGDSYIISDAFFPGIHRLSRPAMEQGRFPTGDVNPRGFMYYPVSVPANPPWEQAARKGIKDACWYMLKIPILPLGIRGIRKFADQIVRWPAIAGSDEKLARELLWLAIVMEDMGTGGGGFRYMYASFLEEAAGLLGLPSLLEFSGRIRESGDKWREFTLQVLHIGKSREFKPESFAHLSRLISERADFEEKFFRELAREV